MELFWSHVSSGEELFLQSDGLVLSSMGSICCVLNEDTLLLLLQSILISRENQIGGLP